MTKDERTLVRRKIAKRLLKKKFRNDNLLNINITVHNNEIACCILNGITVSHNLNCRFMYDKKRNKIVTYGEMPCIQATVHVYQSMWGERLNGHA